MNNEFFSSSLEETKSFGKKLAHKIQKGQIIAFLGDLGSGKTSLIKALVSELNQTPENEICSPTFTYLNIYPGKIDVFHFDLYRIKDEKQFLNMGFDEYFYKDGLCLIEWSEKITSILPSETMIIHILEGKKETERQIVTLML